MTAAVKPIPDRFHSITPALTCRDAARAIEFYKTALGAQELNRMAGPDGKVGHAELKIGDSIFFVSDEFPGMSPAPSASAPNTSTYLYGYVTDANAGVNRAVAPGGRVTMPLDGRCWGGRDGK